MSDPLGLFEEDTTNDPLGLFGEEIKSPSALDSFVKGGKGTLAAAADIASGIVKLPAQAALAIGGKIADPSQNLQSSWESAGQAMEETFPSFGKDMQDNIGYTAPMKPFELYGKGAVYVADKASFGNKDVQGALNIMANFAPIPFASKAGRVVKKGFEFIDPALKDRPAAKAGPDLVSLHEELKAPESVPDQLGLFDDLKATEGPDGQRALFDIHEEGRMPNPYEAVVGDWRIDENGMPIKADLSMDVQNAQTPLQRNLWGDEMAQKHPQEADLNLPQAIDRMDNTTQARENGKFVQGTPQSRAITRLTGNPPLGTTKGHPYSGKIIEMNSGIPFTKEHLRMIVKGGKATGRFVIKHLDGEYRAFVDGQVIGRLASNITAQQAERIGEKASVDIVKVHPDAEGTGVGAALYKAWHDDHKGQITPSGKTSTKAWELWKNKYPEKVDAFVKQEAQRIREGAPRDQVLSNITDPTIAQRVVDAASQGMPFNFRKQGGGIKFEYSKKNERETLKGIPGLKEKIGDLMPDQRPVEQFLKDEAKAPDIDQNALQRLSNYFTKGSVYQAIKTQNPLIKRVSDRVLEAVHTAKGEVANYVHDRLAPAARDLSKQEKADIWAAQQMAEQTKKPLTREVLERNGFNEKQINWVETHADVMKSMLGKMNEAMAATGEKPVSPQIAYLASRASGDFRRLIFKEVNGEKTPVSILGANTRRALDADVKKLQDLHPEWIVGEERFFGGNSKKGGTAEGFSQMLDLLSKNNADVALLAEHVNELLTKDAFNYMNAKTHTMAKKGISGMQGRKEFVDAVTNAEEGMKAQVQYAEKMIQWAEMSKAIADLKPILAKDNGLNMPKAKEWSEQYIQQALGNNPSAVDRAIDKVFAKAFKGAGIGPNAAGKIPQVAKRFVNGILLGFGNIGFMAANLLQPFKSMPEMMSFLKARGLEKSFDAGSGYRYIGGAIVTAFKDASDQPVKPYQKEALQYAKDKHVYSSDLFDSSNTVTKGVGHYWDKGVQFGSNSIEMRTRQVAYLSYVDLLHENGLTAKDGLFETAHKLTDLQMNNYSLTEAPKAYAVAGGIGRTAYNLMSFKHNEYSRMAMLANEMGRSKSAAPLLTHLASSIAFAGVMGTIAYTEADALVKLISKKLGKPTSLTKVLLDNPDIPDQMKYGFGATIGVDLTSRIGTGPLVPGNAVDAVMPGAGKLVNMVKAGYEAVTSPSEYNAKNAIREALPNSMVGLVDRAWFSPKDANGNEMSLNRTKVTPNSTRNDADKVWKTMGMTGMNEAKQKSRDYENDNITRVYTDIRKNLVDKASKEFLMKGSFPSDFAAKYIKAQGNPDSIERELTQIAVEQKMDARTMALMKASMSNSITSTHKLMRMVGRE